MKLPAPHRLAQIYYFPRTAGFALAFAASAVLFYERAISAAQLAYAAGVFLLYPQLVHLWSCLAADKKAAALRGLLIDAFVLATFVATIGFNLGLGFCLATAVCMNNTVYFGTRGLARSAAMFAGGCAVAVGLIGLRFEPLPSGLGTYLGLLTLFVYLMMVASVFYAQNRLLMRAKHEVDRKGLLFQGLAEAGMAMANADGWDELVAGWLQHLQPLLPEGAGRGVIVRSSQRPGLTYHVTFEGMDEAEQARVLKLTAKIVSAQLISHVATSGYRAAGAAGSSNPAPDYDFHRIPVDAGLLEAVFVLRRDHRVTEVERGVVTLFLQQLGAALSNYGLTQRLTELANTDGLTGLANRARLDERLTQVIDLKRRQPGADFCLAVVDINGLKRANDVYGHEAGDRLIMAAADALRTTCRATDLVARMGGDEFIVLCPATTAEEAGHFLRRLAETVRTTTVNCHSGDGVALELPLRFSIGIADSRETDPAAVMKLADRRMYEDKAAYYASHPRD
ncbi:diguanylate cyclase domain-containing protein [Lysobacter korlensis]|uniref:diguanylate cyclase n=1 Tax=Lysobacter korlensis TaxID=553636 RepID=A0ABV6RTW5_9GAMM